MRSQIDKLYQLQIEQSERFSNAFASLAQSQTRKIEFNGFSYTLQLNPARIKSSTANISRPLSEENCFLCKPNMPAEQIKQDWDGEFFISVNPFPILRQHLTIISHTHRPQTIHGHTMRLLRLAEYMEEGYTVFYNSPRSGASAPFHCHFQAGLTEDLPSFCEAGQLMAKYTTAQYGDTSIIQEPTRNIVVIENPDISAAESRLREVLEQLCLIYNTSEPEANIGATISNGKYRIMIFPREKHRPMEYSYEDDRKILISPGFADMAGLIPCVLTQNYEELSADSIKSIMNQVSIPAEKIIKIKMK